MFIARESGRLLTELPERVAVSVVTQNDDFDALARAHPQLHVARV